MLSLAAQWNFQHILRTQERWRVSFKKSTSVECFILEFAGILFGLTKDIQFMHEEQLVHYNLCSFTIVSCDEL
jgi:hypothetical protein